MHCWNIDCLDVDVVEECKVQTYPKKSKSMVEYWAWINAHRPQKKWDAWEDKNKKAVRKNERSFYFLFTFTNNKNQTVSQNQKKK